MGIDVTLQDETGRKLAEIGDRRDIFADALTEEARQGTVCLRFIDPYGDTMFNGLQLPVLIEELEILCRASTGETRAHIETVMALARRGSEDVHLYVKFWGD